jgi:hypothetical protein
MALINCTARDRQGNFELRTSVDQSGLKLVRDIYITVKHNRRLVISSIISAHFSLEGHQQA